MNTSIQIPGSTDIAIPTELDVTARGFITESKAANSRRVYRLQWAQFVAWCGAQVSLPASPQLVANYAGHLATTGRSVSTIQQAMAAIGFAHDTAKLDNPAKHVEVRTTMTGIRRKLGTAAKPKAALSRAELCEVVGRLPNDLRGNRDRALLLIGWAGAFRRSELTALTLDDVTIRREGGGEVMSIHIRRSKTDQEGAGLFKTIPSLPECDPITAWRAWLTDAGIKSGPAFRSIDRWGHIHGAMGGQEVARIVKAACLGAGIDPARFAGHSLRSGFVTAATLAGANDSDVMEQTGHKSSATLRRYKQLAGLGAKRATLAAFGQ